MEKQFVTFKLGSELYGIPIESVERILPIQPLTKMPRSPKLVIGVFDLRGSTIAAIDARTRFEMPPAEEPHNFVVIQHEEDRFAMQVDQVEGIISFGEDEIDATDQLLTGTDDQFVSGIGKKGDKITVLLTPGELITSAVRSKLTKVA